MSEPVEPFVSNRTSAAHSPLRSFPTLDSLVRIRPSGNPITPQGMAAMFGSGDIEPGQSKLIGVDSIRLLAGGAAAVATYTHHSTFKYKGIPNDDIAKFTAVLEKTPEGWKMVHGHRSTGQPPEKRVEKTVPSVAVENTTAEMVQQ